MARSYRFRQFLEHIQSLGYYDTPDYDMLAGIFERCLKRRGVKDTDPFDWEIQAAQQATGLLDVKATVTAGGSDSRPGAQTTTANTAAEPAVTGIGPRERHAARGATTQPPTAAGGNSVGYFSENTNRPDTVNNNLNVNNNVVVETGASPAATGPSRENMTVPLQSAHQPENR